MSKWIEGLNSEQGKAALHNYGPMLILAGAGSGKTTVLVARTGRMIDERIVTAEQICVLTFTNKAARELKERVADKVGKAGRKIMAGTFHSFGLGILKKYHSLVSLPKNFGIIDSGDARSIVRDCLKDISHAAKDDFDPDKLLSIINRLRENSKAFDTQKSDPYYDMAEMIKPRFEKKLELLGVVDFEALLLKPLELFEKHPEVLKIYQDQYQQIMVDEFQDTNAVQMRLILKLAADHNNITVVGDDDQAIYGWRGAQVSNILNFPRLFGECKVVRLVKNYRSTKSILDIANHLIKNNKQRHDKVLEPGQASEHEHKPEVFIYENEQEEAEEIMQQIHYFVREGFEYNDIAILYRSNSQGGLLEGLLRQTKIPYSLTGGSAFFDRKEVKDVLAYLRSAFYPHEVCFRRILSTPPRGIGEKSIKAIEEQASEMKFDFISAARWVSQKQALTPQVHNNFIKLFQELDELKSGLLNDLNITAGNYLLNALKHNGFYDHVLNSYKDKASGGKRWVLVEILSRVMDSFIEKGERSAKTIKEFLDSMELRDQLDEASNQKEKSKVQLMTLHACKGLEFPVTIIVGVEEDLIPHKLLGTDVDEERRLFYVGLTRAKKRLVLTRARQRKRYGKMRPVSPSRFLLEIPNNMLEYFDGGHRPLAEVDRKAMMADLFKKIDSRPKGPI